MANKELVEILLSVTNILLSINSRLDIIEDKVCNDTNSDWLLISELKEAICKLEVVTKGL